CCVHKSSCGFDLEEHSGRSTCSFSISSLSPQCTCIYTTALGRVKNGKKPEGSSFFTWFIVLALLGVWTSVAVVYFDLVDYQGVIGKLESYDADGDGDFDVEDAKVLLGKCRIWL
uniref:Aspartyl beta-hydroxylase/Triadin domain-containing protein n=1 Tax=Electrophorus electricus TaxID=8005 RepID=A0A4W4F0Y5_ELEEL